MNCIRCGMAQAKLTRIALRLRRESAINNNKITQARLEGTAIRDNHNDRILFDDTHNKNTLCIER